MKRRRILIVIGGLLLIAGVGIMTYPYICQKLYVRKTKEMINDYKERIEAYKESEDDDLEWLYQLMVKYNENLYENGQKDLVDAFSYQQVDFSLTEFGFDEEMIGHLSIPKMDIELPIYLGASKDNLARGAAHLTQTSLPVGGMNTNAVIVGHRGFSTAAMFRDIEKLEKGDDVLITNFRETLTYQVVETMIILPTDIDRILIQDGKDMVTLITCHPYRHNYQRYVVYCERIQ